MAGVTSPSQCIFCQIARNSTSTTILHSDDKVLAFQDIKPSAFRHYLVIPVEHIPTVRNLQRQNEDYSLVCHMLNVGKSLLHGDAPQSQYRFGFHQPPFNSVDHLHLHCFALPFTPRYQNFGRRLRPTIKGVRFVFLEIRSNRFAFTLLKMGRRC